MKKILLLLVISLFVINSCNKDSDPTSPSDHNIQLIYENQGSIGTKGGKVQVSSSSSPIKGAFVDIPNGAIGANITVNISPGTADTLGIFSTSSISVKFEPDGQKFSSLIKIAIPFGNNDPTEIGLFYYQRETAQIQEIAIDSIDFDNKLLIGRTDHFSEYFAGKHSTYSDITLFNDGGKIACKLKVFGKNYSGVDIGFKGIPVSIFTGTQNAEDLIENYSRNPVYSIFYARLIQYGTILNVEKETKGFYVLRAGAINAQILGVGEISEKYVNGAFAGVEYRDPIFETKTLYFGNDKTLRYQLYSGEPLIIRFNTIIDYSKKYYVELTWDLNSIKDVSNYLASHTAIYSFTNRKNSKRINELTTLTGDLDLNGIEDNFQNLVSNTTQTPPTVTTAGITNISSNSATGGGNVTAQGSSSVTAKGVCWSTSQNPTTSNSKTLDGTGTGSFSSSLTGLNPGTTYYVRAYATNSTGASYGNQLSFITTSAGTVPSKPTLSSPGNGATNQSTTPTLTWNASTGATSYSLSVWRTDNENNVFLSYNLTSTSQQITGLENNVNYTWYVNANNDYGSSGWSERWTFTTANDGNTSGELVAYYPFNGNANDESGNSTNLTISNCSLVEDRFNNPNRAYYFDGISSSMRANCNSLFSVNTVTICAWIKIHGSGQSNPRIVAVGDFSNMIRYYGLLFEGTSASRRLWYLQNWGNSSNVVSEFSQKRFSNDNAWHFVSITNNGSSLAFYIDGVKDVTINKTNSFDQFSTAELQIGFSNNNNDHFNGVIDDIRIYSKALVESEIQDLYKENGWQGGSSVGGSPCPGIPTVIYEGKTYNTVQIGDQCWLKENLDIGTMIQSTQDQKNNGTIEKYCYNNEPINCVTYGGLYQWNEAMQYVLTLGATGICPEGWHLPTISEYQILFLNVNSNLNSLLQVGQNQGTNSSGFSALLSGYKQNWNEFTKLNQMTKFYSSNENDSNSGDGISINSSDNSFNTYHGYQSQAFSVRCIKD